MFRTLLPALVSALLAQQAFAQTEPTPASAASKWQLYVEAGPKTSRFSNVYYGTNYLTPVPAGYQGGYYYEYDVDNTYAAFADVKAFKHLSKHLVFSGSTGLDLQQLDFTSRWRASLPGFTSNLSGEHVTRLLTRVRVDAGLHYAFGLGATGQLMPGVSLGQMLNVSKNGFSYSYIQPELCYTMGNVLLSARASFMPYNTTIPDIEAISRREERPLVERNEYRISELQLGIGVKL